MPSFAGTVATSSVRATACRQFVEHLDCVGRHFDGKHQPLMPYFDREGKERAACDLVLGKVDEFRYVGVTARALVRVLLVRLELDGRPGQAVVPTLRVGP